tara:strand:+ start:1255 stop:1902 length:648 start_codon:yes stop_codon:yes gene_type:complete
MGFKNQKTIIKLWFIPPDLKLQKISEREKKWSLDLSESRRNQFQYSRGYTRLALSTYFKNDPLDIPLFSKPGKAPLLDKGFGFVSISHCNDGLFIGWSNTKIGVDIEPLNRNINVKRFSDYLLSNEEIQFIHESGENNVSEKLLSIWVRKEALVKYSQGNIFRDFKSWKINQSKNTASLANSSTNISVYNVNYQKWLLGVASEKEPVLYPPVEKF